METNKILSADILDIIFDGKNKLYGAYELRKTYNRRLVKAICFTIVLVLFAFLGSVFSGMTGKNVSGTVDVLDTRLADVKKNDAPLPPPLPPAKVLPAPEMNQVKFTPPIIVKDALVNADEQIEEITDDQVISIKTVESNYRTQIILAPVDEKDSRIIEAPKTDDENTVFIKVENEAQFPGGQQAWIRYLQNKLNANAPVDNGAPSGKYQVIVKFIVSKDGSISDVNAETSYGFGMEDEAVKIIKLGPKWQPALQNGRNVNAYRRQPITFVVEER